MPIQQPQYPMRFVPRGLVDALDATDRFMGACINMVNLVFDQSNPEQIISRPGVTETTNFSGFSVPTTVSVFVVIGDMIYGMIDSDLNPGTDQPFAYNHASGAFVAISGITAANSPATQPTSGAWEPPTMAMVGTRLYVTHPGFSGANRFGVIDLSAPATPSWTATDTSTNGLSARPQAVANFANRAYFAVGNSLEYTDVLSINRAASSQALTIGDSTDISGLSGLPVQTTSGGVVQALLAFKEFQIWQVTGDAASANLAQNYLSLTLGCPAPRTIVAAPKGVYFVSTSGPYIVSPVGAVSPVAFSRDDETPDIVAPFQNCSEYTRAAAAYSSGIYRVCLDTVIRGTTGRNDYWFDELRRRWTGPHSFPYDCAAQHGNHFVLCSNSNSGSLFHSNIRSDSNTVYTDDGVATKGTMRSALMPKPGHMTQKQTVESTIELASGGGPVNYTVSAIDDGETTLSAVTITAPAVGGVWNAFVWGDGTRYASATPRPRVFTVPWDVPLVFKRVSFEVSAAAASALSMGPIYSRYQDLGYTNYNPEQV